MSGPDQKRRLPRRQILSRNAVTIAVVLSLCAWVADVAFPPLLSERVSTAAELLAIVGMALLAFWSWRQQRRMQASIEQLIDAAERLSRSEFSQPVTSGSTGYLGLLQRAFERMRVALHDTT